MLALGGCFCTTFRSTGDDGVRQRLADRVKVTVYVSEITRWKDVDEVYVDFFGGHRSARAVVPTATLHDGAAIEVEAVARMPGSRT